MRRTTCPGRKNASERKWLNLISASITHGRRSWSSAPSGSPKPRTRSHLLITMWTGAVALCSRPSIVCTSNHPTGLPSAVDDGFWGTLGLGAQVTRLPIGVPEPPIHELVVSGCLSCAGSGSVWEECLPEVERQNRNGTVWGSKPGDGADLRLSAARSYSLTSRPRTDRRLICWWSRSGAGCSGRGGAKLQRSMWPPAVVVGDVPGKDSPPVAFAEDQDAVGELGSGVRTNRSAKQFALGHCGGIFTVSILRRPRLRPFSGSRWLPLGRGRGAGVEWDYDRPRHDLGETSLADVSLLASTLQRVDHAAYGRTLREISQRLDALSTAAAVPRATGAEVRGLEALCERAAPAEQVAPLRAALDRGNWVRRGSKLELAPEASSRPGRVSGTCKQSHRWSGRSPGEETPS
jgi:hypothetical protein